MPLFGGDRIISPAEISFWKALRIIGPIAAFSATVGVADMLDLRLISEDYTWSLHAYELSVYSLGILMIPGGTALFLQSMLNRAYAHRSRSWPVAKGTVIESATTESYGGSMVWFYAPRISVRYTVAGRDYENEDIQFGRAAYGSPQTATSLAKRFPVGATVDVHHNPIEPDISVLETSDSNARRSAWIGLLLIVLPFPMALFIVWYNSG